MVSWRTRESEKQALCREQNESSARARSAPSGGGGGSFRCECGDRDCACAITLTATEYEVVRASATHFVVARNHENPESERVVLENERFATVEIVTGEATKLARRSDPRQRRRERRWAKATGSGAHAPDPHPSAMNTDD
jgi:hypothetical protein